MTSLVDFPYWRKEKGNIRFCLVCLPSLTCRIKIDVSFRFKFGICVLQIGVSFEFSVIWWSVNVSDNHSHNLRKGPPVTTVLLIQYLILNLVLLWGIRLCSLMIIWFSMFWQYGFSESYCASKFVLEVSSWIPLCLYHMTCLISFWQLMTKTKQQTPTAEIKPIGLKLIFASILNLPATNSSG